MSYEKLLGLELLIGKAIIRYDLIDRLEMRLYTACGKTFSFILDDEGGPCDSTASFSNIDLDRIFGRAITDCDLEYRDSYQGLFKIKTDGQFGEIEVNHDHNGYYTWSHYVQEVT